ncbi:MAG: hypothetical protein GWN62_32180, partial [Aliifodinibius sp.]|nr:hypothetical protein [Fodinibius sp.]
MLSGGFQCQFRDCLRKAGRFSWLALTFVFTSLVAIIKAILDKDPHGDDSCLETARITKNFEKAFNPPSPDG